MLSIYHIYELPSTAVDGTAPWESMVDASTKLAKMPMADADGGCRYPSLNRRTLDSQARINKILLQRNIQSVHH